MILEVRLLNAQDVMTLNWLDVKTAEVMVQDILALVDLAGQIN